MKSPDAGTYAQVQNGQATIKTDGVQVSFLADNTQTYINDPTGLSYFWSNNIFTSAGFNGADILFGDGTNTKLKATTNDAVIEVKTNTITASLNSLDYLKIEPATLTIGNGATNWTMPTTRGTNGQVLITSPIGICSWQTPSTGYYTAGFSGDSKTGLITYYNVNGYASLACQGGSNIDTQYPVPRIGYIRSLSYRLGALASPLNIISINQNGANAITFNPVGAVGTYTVAFLLPVLINDYIEVLDNTLGGAPPLGKCQFTMLFSIV
jgi:hypothetical protein